MNKAIKKLWIDALLGNLGKKYEQGTGCLRKAKRYCCLGVLCDLYIKAHNNRWARMDRSLYSFMGAAITLPHAVMKWAGLKSESPAAGGQALTYANDGGSTFVGIAKLIKKHL